MARLICNIFAPDPEDISFNLHKNADASEETLLRAQVAAYDRDLAIIGLKPSYEGSFDVEIDGTQDNINWLIDEWMLVPGDYEVR